MLIKGAEKLFKVAQMGIEEQKRYKKEQREKEMILSELRDDLEYNSKMLGEPSDGEIGISSKLTLTEDEVNRIKEAYEFMNPHDEPLLDDEVGNFLMDIFIANDVFKDIAEMHNPYNSEIRSISSGPWFDLTGSGFTVEFFASI